MVISGLLIATGVLLAYANGGNDNFKGVATLFGSETADYSHALRWATGATFLGSMASILVAGKLVTLFRGAGLVSADLAAGPAFLPAVACGAALTVLLATWRGLPVSTTHGLLGALLGPAIVTQATAIDLGYLSTKFVIPLLLSPLMAIGLSWGLYSIFRFSRQTLGIEKEMCLCAGGIEYCYPVVRGDNTLALEHRRLLAATVETVESCEERYRGRVFGISVQRALDLCHYASSGLVCFARGLNDTPKIAAVLLAAGIFGAQWSGLWVAVGMAIGGVISARKIGDIMGKDITPLNHGQGFTANLVTGVLVVAASPFGLPVSTTHVSCGSIFGIGIRTKEGNPRVMGTILLAWVVTLPLAAALAAACYAVFNALTGGA